MTTFSVTLYPNRLDGTKRAEVHIHWDPIMCRSHPTAINIYKRPINGDGFNWLDATVGWPSLGGTDGAMALAFAKALHLSFLIAAEFDRIPDSPHDELGVSHEPTLCGEPTSIAFIFEPNL